MFIWTKWCWGRHWWLRLSLWGGMAFIRQWSQVHGEEFHRDLSSLEKALDSCTTEKTVVGLKLWQNLGSVRWWQVEWINAAASLSPKASKHFEHLLAVFPLLWNKKSLVTALLENQGLVLCIDNEPSKARIHMENPKLKGTVWIIWSGLVWGTYPQ